MKSVLWIIGIAIGVFLGMLAYEQYTAYRVEQQIAQMLEGQAAAQKATNARRVVELERQRKSRLEANTLCAMNNDTQKCVCIHEETGIKISKTHDECVARASKASNIKRLN